MKTKAQQINVAKENRQIAKLWKKAKTHDNIISKKPKPIQCPGLATYFKNHFNPDHTNLTTPQEIQSPPEYIKVLQDYNIEINNAPPTQEEIMNAIKQLNKGKSTIDVETEVLICASSIPNFTDSLELYFHRIWTDKEIPEQWRISRITPIWKNKGSAHDPTKYRGISIGSILCKVGMNIVLKRLSEFYEKQLKNNQFGFRSGVGCSDGIYVIKQLQDIATLSQRELYVCFVDLSSAFDHVNRKLLFQTIRNRLHHGQSTTTIDIMENLYAETKCYMQDDNPTEAFPTESGVRQGGVEGPPLYNYYSDYALRVYSQRNCDAGVTGLKIPYQIPVEATNREQRTNAPASGTTEDDEVGYADDLGVFSWSCHELQVCMAILVQVFEEFGLEINLTKTETMIINWKNTNATYPSSIISINGKNITNSTSFKYLGVYINYNSTHIGKDELDNRINSAHNAFSEHRKLLKNMNVPLKTRITFLNALVRSRLTYGCHCWRPTLQELNKIETTFRYFLRSMVWSGHSRVNPPTPSSPSHISSSDTSSDDEETDWRYIITNAELYKITNTNTIKEFSEKRQQSWIAHVIRRDNRNLCKNLTFHNVKRTKLGRKSPSILEKAIISSGMDKDHFLKSSFLRINQR